MEPKFFATQADLHQWFVQNHNRLDECWIGFYKKATGIPSITWPESVDEALCFGWIDGIRKKVDEQAYMIRFTPRRPRSIWSAVNIKRFAELKAMGLVMPEGQAAYDRMDEKKARIYSYERETAELAPAYVEQFQQNEKAWAWFNESLAPSYCKTSKNWVMRAKREETRQRRLQILIESCEEGKKIPLLRRKGE
jgi:uncharacterized protein YdeI (YjbR/CyaY-like superfamily)